jgi:hypothetical protein
MSSGAMCNYADTVEDYFIKAICPNEFADFIEYVQKTNAELETVALFLDEYMGQEEEKIEDVSEEEDKEIRKLYLTLQSSFSKKTCLQLVIRFADDGNGGSCYDEVDGAFWEVEGVYQLTPAAKKYKDKIERKYWVTYV